MLLMNRNKQKKLINLIELKMIYKIKFSNLILPLINQLKVTKIVK